MDKSLIEPSLSILIITYNRAEDTLALIEDLKTQVNLSQHVGEILLLNNASTTDYTVIDQFLQDNPNFPIKYTLHDKNLGVAGGRNYLIQRAKFPFLMMLDDDMVFPERNSIEKAAVLWSKPQFKDLKIAIITIGVFYYDTRERQKSALPHKQFELYKDKDWFLTYYFAGGAHIVRREVFDEIGLYPEDFFYGMEEYDLSYRIIEAGYALGYDDSVRVLHKESPTGRVTNKQKLGMMWYNKSVVAWRYLPKRYFYSTLLMWGIHYLIKSKFDLKGFFQIAKKIRTISSNIPKQKMGKKALIYLKTVHARLWY